MDHSVKQNPCMRRYETDCLLGGNKLLTDNERFQDCYGFLFDDMCQQTFDWLKTQELVVFTFQAGRTYQQPNLHSLGRQIIDCCLDGGSIEDYEALISRRAAKPLATKGHELDCFTKFVRNDKNLRNELVKIIGAGPPADSVRIDHIHAHERLLAQKSVDLHP